MATWLRAATVPGVRFPGVEINGIMLAFLDIAPEFTQEYNRWYDLDHMPEHVAKHDVIMGRRYVAPKHLHEVEGAQVAEFGHPPYVTLYFFGGPLDMMSKEARDGWTTTDAEIVRAGRYWKEGRGVSNTYWRLAASTARPSVLVQRRAVPHLNHRGIVVAWGKGRSVDDRQAALDWWDQTHLVDLFAVPGVLAALRFDPVAEANADQLLHIILCEDPPGEVMPRIDAAMKYAKAVGRYPAHKGAYESLAFLPYDRIVPLEYDFDFS
jgi:hypothetical protein